MVYVTSGLCHHLNLANVALAPKRGHHLAQVLVFACPDHSGPFLMQEVMVVVALVLVAGVVMMVMMVVLVALKWLLQVSPARQLRGSPGWVLLL